jgi:hypothetical protein
VVLQLRGLDERRTTPHRKKITRMLRNVTHKTCEDSWWGGGRNANKNISKKISFGNGKPVRRWEENNEVDIIKRGCEGVHSGHLAQDRVRWWALVNMVMSFRVS